MLQAGRPEQSKPLDNRQEAMELNVYPAGFQSYFCQVVFHYAPIPPFLSGNIYFVPLCI